MGYGSYLLPDGRWAGYNIEAECDHRECHTMIDRGLGYLCGREPDGHREPSEPGCGKYFCMKHMDDHDCPNPDGHNEDEDTEDGQSDTDRTSDAEPDEDGATDRPGVPLLQPGRDVDLQREGD